MTPLTANAQFEAPFMLSCNYGSEQTGYLDLDVHVNPSQSRVNKRDATITDDAIDWRSEGGPYTFEISIDRNRGTIRVAPTDKKAGSKVTVLTGTCVGVERNI